MVPVDCDLDSDGSPRDKAALRSPAGTNAENIFIWWPPDNYLVAKIFSAVVPAGLRTAQLRRSY